MGSAVDPLKDRKKTTHLSLKKTFDHQVIGVHTVNYNIITLVMSEMVTPQFKKERKKVTPQFKHFHNQ